MRGLAWLLVGCVLLAACTVGPDVAASSPPSGASPSTAVTIPGTGAATRWGDGPYGLVLLHPAGGSAAAWGPQAAAFAADGMTVLAPEATGPDALRTTISWLHDDLGLARVAVLAVSDAAGSVASLAASDARLIDQAILISPPAGLDWTAPFPKLFAASSGEPAAAAAREAEAQAAGTWNVLDLVDGSASGTAIFSSVGGSALMSEVLRRLDDRR